MPNKGVNNGQAKSGHSRKNKVTHSLRILKQFISGCRLPVTPNVGRERNDRIEPTYCAGC